MTTMTNIEKLRKQLNALEAKEDILRKQRLDNQDEISRLKELLEAEERKLANTSIMPLRGKYVKWTQTDKFGHSIFKHIRIDRIKQKEGYSNEYIIHGQLVEISTNASDEVDYAKYDKAFQGEINLGWKDPFSNQFKPEDLTEIGEDEFNLAKNMIKDLLS